MINRLASWDVFVYLYLYICIGYDWAVLSKWTSWTMAEFRILEHELIIITYRGQWRGILAPLISGNYIKWVIWIQITTFYHTETSLKTYRVWNRHVFSSAHKRNVWPGFSINNYPLETDWVCFELPKGNKTICSKLLASLIIYCSEKQPPFIPAGHIQHSILR